MGFSKACGSPPLAEDLGGDFCRDVDRRRVLPANRERRRAQRSAEQHHGDHRADNDRPPRALAGACARADCARRAPERRPDQGAPQLRVHARHVRRGPRKHVAAPGPRPVRRVQKGRHRAPTPNNRPPAALAAKSGASPFYFRIQSTIVLIFRI